MKALILAAGFGTRLRPITDSIPKPLCPFFGVKFIDLAIHRVKDHCSDIAINTHHLSHRVSSHIRETYGPDLYISHEPEIRGTGGSLYPLIDWLQDDDLIIYNADIISNISIDNMIKKFVETRSYATMTMLPIHLKDKTPVFCDQSRVLSFGKTPQQEAQPLTFSGIHIVSNQFVKSIPNEVPWSVIDTYKEQISRGQTISVYSHSSYWADLGTPASLWSAHIDLLKRKDAWHLLDQIGVNQIRKDYGQPKIILNTQSHSAWSDGLHFNYKPNESFIDQSQPLDHRVDKSIIVNSSLGHFDQSIQNCLVIDDIMVNFLEYR